MARFCAVRRVCVAAAFMIAAWWVLPCGCAGGGDRRVVQIDSLAAGERLMLMKYLPPGLSETEVRQRLPHLGGVDTVDGTASQPITVLGQPATLEVTFRDGALVNCGFALVCSESATASFLYRELQRSYTAELGNYHEDFGDTVRPARSFWSFAGYGLVLTLGGQVHRYRLIWRFELLPPRPEQEPPPAA